jgi:hypothetical protein
VGEDGVLDAGCFAPLELGRDPGVSDVQGATASNQRTIERRAIADKQIHIAQSGDVIREVSHVGHIEDVTRPGRDAISHGGRQHRVLHGPGFDEQAGERERMPGRNDVSHRDRPRRHRAP